jgi:hypothetical protein
MRGPQIWIGILLFLGAKAPLGIASVSMVTLSRYWMAPGWSWLKAFWKLEKTLKLKIEDDYPLPDQRSAHARRGLDARKRPPGRCKKN